MTKIILFVLISLNIVLVLVCDIQSESTFTLYSFFLYVYSKYNIKSITRAPDCVEMVAFCNQNVRVCDLIFHLVAHVRFTR